MACATRTIERVLPKPPGRAVSLREALEAHEEYCRGIRSVSASGDLDVKDLRAGKQRKMGVRLLATRGDRLYLKGTVLVVTALELISNGDRFWFHVPSKKTVWTGPASATAPQAEGADQAPYYALRPRDVTGALLPDPLAPTPEDSLVMEAEADTLWLILARTAEGRGLVRRRVGLDRQRLRPIRLLSFDERGELASQARLGAWSERGPREVVIERPAEGYVASFSLQRLETNANLPERAFEPRPSEGYRTIEVGE